MQTKKVLNSLIAQMKDFESQEKKALKNKEWDLLETIEEKKNNLMDQYQKACGATRLIEVSSFRMTNKTINLVSECIGTTFDSDQVNELVKSNYVTLFKPFKGGYMVK